MNINLDRYREGKAHWGAVAYTKASSQYGKYDKNEKNRYAVLLSLQYDFKTEDEELIRYLFKQEIIARENDSFQGIGEALYLAAYLLAQFKSKDDIPLFYKAKFANFDTACGFDREFMYVAIREKTEAFVEQYYPDLLSEIEGGYISMNLGEKLDVWWDKVKNRYPDNEADELLLDLYDRSIYFEKMEAAKIYLEKWKAIEPESKEKDSTLKYAYKELGEYAQAIEFTKKELESKKTNWDKASVNGDLLKLCTKIKALEGLDIIVVIDELFKQFDDWKDIGLGRMTIHEAFEYSLALDNIEAAKQAFKYAHRWFNEMDSIAFVGLEAGWKSAEKSGFKTEAKMYKRLASEERARIDNSLK